MAVSKYQKPRWLIFLDPVYSTSCSGKANFTKLDFYTILARFVANHVDKCRLNGILVYTVYVSLISDVCRYDIKYIVSTIHFWLLHESKMHIELIFISEVSKYTNEKTNGIYINNEHLKPL